MNKRKNKTLKLTLLGMLIAIIIIQNFVPFLGYIPVGPLSITIIQVTVMIAAIVLGPIEGAILGLVWGLITFVRAFTYPTSPIAPLVFTNPIVSVLPRVLVGLIAGIIYKKLNQTKFPRIGAMSVASIIGSAINTVLVLGLIYVFYRGAYAHAYHLDLDKILPALLVIVCTNGIAEAIISGIITPAISRPLMRIYKK